MEANDRIKINRAVLIEYAGKGCHWEGEPTGGKGPYRAIWHNDESGHDWETVRRNVRDLCKEYGLLIELDRYPKTKLITITLCLKA